MRKKGKLFTVIFTFLFLLLSAAGCGKEFDASGYLKAVLDNSYKHDPTAFLDQKIGSEEEAEQLFQEGIDANIAALTESASVSQEQEQNFRAIFEQIYAQADYTVGEAQKQEDDSYVVTVTYRPMTLFADTQPQLEEQTEQLTNSYMEQIAAGGEAPDEETLTGEIMELYMGILQDAAGSVNYGEETSCQVRIQLDDNVYIPNTDDLMTLENGILGVGA